MDAKSPPTAATLGSLLDLYTTEAQGRPDTAKLFSSIAAEHFSDWRWLPPDKITRAMLDARWVQVLAKVAGRTTGRGDAMTLLAFGVLAGACREGLDRHLIEGKPPLLDFVRERRRLYRQQRRDEAAAAATSSA